MNKQDKKGTAIRLVVGMLIIVLSLLSWHFLNQPDYVNGLFLGIGIGVLALAVIRR